MSTCLCFVTSLAHVLHEGAVPSPGTMTLLELHKAIHMPEVVGDSLPACTAAPGLAPATGPYTMSEGEAEAEAEEDMRVHGCG